MIDEQTEIPHSVLQGSAAILGEHEEHRRHDRFPTRHRSLGECRAYPVATAKAMGSGYHHRV